ncbi:hypothetical protein OsJ_10282 [Oryza sativa Japonica Group]|uniref:DUF674 family protein n=1 Tax=Oryza sativa subsp. japonica TaxID=39947 RepID=B9F790_ORYSJ|nr:hypothetical protein OsJ_10282 [Oryza sativa Japonica Group]
MSTSNNGGPTVAVKLYIDKEKKKVLFAESDKEFVDVLFSFLTLPLGTIVRLLGKQSQIGCLDELYKSVEALSEDYFQTKACKAMLLRPRNAAGSHCDRLKVKVDDTNERLIYVCPTSSCDARSFSSFWGVCNSCTVTTTLILREKPVDCRTVESNDDGVFVKSDLKFIIFDDLHVAPASTSTMFPLLGKFGLLEQRNIEEKVLELNSHKIGCLDELYKSVEALSEDYFQTKACKAMLLRPRNAAGSHCDRLKVKVDDTNERLIYVCPTSSCDARSFSSFWGVCNSCTVTTTLILREKPVDCRTVESNDDGVFVKSDLKFIIFDDLHVAPASTSTMFPLLGKFGLLEQRNIEEKVLELNSHKIINLLKRALVSKQSLTGLLCDHPVETDSVNLDHLREKLFPKQENTTDPKFNAVGYDFVDLVFGLLSLPLGSTIKAYGQVTSGGSSGLDNLYRSINGSGIGCVKQECQSLLLSPMLAPFFGCGSSVLLQVQESPIKSCSLRVIRAAKIPNEMLVKKELTLDRTQVFHLLLQVLKLLRAALVTRNALSSVLLPPKK